MEEWIVISVLVRHESLDALLGAASRFGLDISAYEEPIENVRAADGYQVRVLTEVPIEVQFFARADGADLSDLIEAFRKVTLAPPIQAIAFERRRSTSNDSTTEKWREYHTPIDIDGRLLLCPNWIEPPAFAGVVIRTTPGGAFGTGQHVSTRDSLRLLMAHLCPGEMVADLGAGCGVLSAAARCFGSGPVLAVEIDRIDEIGSLAQLNGLDGITAIRDDWRDVDLNGISLLLANISATDASDLVDHASKLSPKPRMILSGIAAWSLEPVELAIDSAGYEIQDRTSEDGEWVTLYVIPRK